MPASHHIRVRVTEWKLAPNAPQLYRHESVSERVFVPPKPKPVLPDVKPGAVISFKSRMGSERVAIRGNFGWRVFENGSSVVYVGMNWAEPIATDADLLKDIGDGGFKLMVTPL